MTMFMGAPDTWETLGQVGGGWGLLVRVRKQGHSPSTLDFITNATEPNRKGNRYKWAVLGWV